MSDRTEHSGLELRLMALETRIATLKQKVAGAGEFERIERLSEVNELDRRHKMLGEQLARLDSEGPGFRQDVKANIEAVADVLSGAIEDFMMRADSGFRPTAHPKQPSEP